MTVRLYSLWDSVAEEFGPLFQAKNDDVALRNVVQMFTEMKVKIVSVQSFLLYYVGDFDTETGHLVEPAEGAIAIDIDYDVLANIFDAYTAYWANVKSKENNVSRETKEEK